MHDKNITDTHVDEFRQGLESIHPLIVAGGKQSASRNASSRDWSQSDLQALSEEIVEATRLIFERARFVCHRLQDEWKGNPRLCNVSLLGPLALLNKEVPLTNAIAWLITPQELDHPLHAALLAALLELVLDRRISPANVSDWQVDAEKVFENADGRCRIDIYIEGLIDSKKHRIAIEAKVNAPEGKRQLEKYEMALRERATEIEKEHQHIKDESEICVVFLTRPGRQCKSSKTAKSVSYADVLGKWLPVLQCHSSEPAAPFARLLMADIARDLADMHIGDQLSGKHGLPKFVDEGSMQITSEIHNG